MKELKLGVIGLSAGNGHPYSWSAIFNGYHQTNINSCPFPVIPAYLAKQQFPRDKIKGARVSHIWTQDRKTSQQIADAVFIPEVLDDLPAMANKVDAILLARDDAENHLEMALPFLNAGLPIYIDKPLSYTVEEAKTLFSKQQYSGQLFTCSAFQFAKELSFTPELKNRIGKIIHVDAFIKNDWNKYAIHLIEPIIKIIGHDLSIRCVDVVKNENYQGVHYKREDGITINIKVFKHADIRPSIILFGEKAMAELVFKDTYAAFKSALQQFIDGILLKKEMINQKFVLRCIEMIESANEKT